MPNDKMPYAKKIKHQQLHLQFQQAPQILAVSTLISMGILFVLWYEVELNILSVWFMLICAGNLARWLLIRAYKRNTEPQSATSLYQYRFNIITGLTGLVWGVGSLIFLTQIDLNHQMFIAATLFGVSAGAQVSYAFSSTTYRLFTLPSLLIPAVWFLFQDEKIVWLFGILCLLYTLVLYVLSSRSHQTLVDNLYMRYKNMELLQHSQSLLTLDKALSQASNHNEIIDAVAVEIEKSLGYKNSWVYLADKDSLTYHLLASHTNFQPLQDLAKKFPSLPIKGDLLLEEIHRSTKPVVVIDAEQDHRTNKDIVHQLGNKTIINIPMLLANKHIGALGTGSFGNEGVREPSTSQLTYLSSLTTHMALAIDRIHMFNERLNMQEALAQAQRQDSLGLMAGGIAHDFNNILTSILGSASQAEMKVSTDTHSSKAHINTIIHSCKRAAELSNQMLAYSGQANFVLDCINLSEVVQSTLPMIKSSIVTHIDLSENTPLIKADALQIQQVIIGLALNAAEAMQNTAQGNKIHIRTGECTIHEQLAESYYGKKPTRGLYAFLEVTDHGCGMDKTTLNRLFDPFFTTKFIGRGLGMSEVLGIVNGHHGSIFVDSHLGEGTTFKLIFPVSTSPCYNVKKTASQPRKQHNHERTILVIDDESVLCDIAQETLKAAGFKVMVTTSAQDGIEIYRQHQNIDLVLLDMTMPSMSGEQCLQHLRQINKHITVLIVSGYSKEHIFSMLDKKHIAGFLGKPYLPKEMIAAIDQALETSCEA